MVNLDHLHLIKVKSPLGVFNNLPPAGLVASPGPQRRRNVTKYLLTIVSGADFSFNSLWEFRVLLDRTQTDGSFLLAVLRAHTCHARAPPGM